MRGKAWMLWVVLAAVLLGLLFILLSGPEAIGTPRMTGPTRLHNSTQGLALEIGP
jgi:hypothetical protein